MPIRTVDGIGSEVLEIEVQFDRQSTPASLKSKLGSNSNCIATHHVCCLSSESGDLRLVVVFMGLFHQSGSDAGLRLKIIQVWIPFHFGGSQKRLRVPPIDLVDGAG